MKIYANGHTAEYQRKADQAYRAKQRRLRAWASELAEMLDIDKDRIPDLTGGELAHRLREAGYG